MIKPDQLFRPPEGGSLDQPIDHLMACHRRIEDRLSTLERVAGHLTDQRTEAMQALQACFRFFETSGAWHTADEEQSLFPRMRAALRPEELAYLDHLEAQHEEAEGEFAKLKAIAAQMAEQPAPEPALVESYRDTVGRLSRLYRQHIQSEDETLTAMGKRVLTPEDLAAIAAEMKHRRGLEF